MGTVLSQERYVSPVTVYQVYNEVQLHTRLQVFSAKRVAGEDNMYRQRTGSHPGWTHLQCLEHLVGEHPLLQVQYLWYFISHSGKHKPSQRYI